MSGDPPRRTPTDLLESLSRELKDAFREWADAPDPGQSWDEDMFRELALRVFRIQYRGNAPYRRFCQRRDRSPGAVSDWREVPAVPTAGFRAVPLVVGDPEEAALEFRTSGTSGRMDRRGRHLIRDPSLYRASLEAGFRALVLSRLDADEGTAPRRMLSLIPSFPDAPHSSLSFMVDALVERFAPGEGVFAATGSGIDWSRATGVARSAARDEAPLVVLATTLAAAEWMERLGQADLRVELPPGSLLMDTGGAKGRRDLDRARVMARVERHLGLAGASVVNEFGMTELLSQRYSAPDVDAGSPWLAGPPWLRTRALDPETLAELPKGRVGLLCHHDLANAGSVSVVLTEDLGRVQGGRLQYLGRAGGSPPRGCSLATAELLDAQPESVDTDWSVCP